MKKGYKRKQYFKSQLNAGVKDIEACECDESLLTCR